MHFIFVSDVFGVHIGFNMSDSALRRSVPFSYQKFDETIDSHLLFPNSAIFEKRVAEISPELFAIVS